MRKKKTKKKLGFFAKLGIFTLMGLSFVGGVWWVATMPNATANEATRLTDETHQFIETIAPIAVELSEARDLYPSVTIAQAVLESQSGTSGLAGHPSYNLFGVKGNYNGNSVTLPTYEDDGKGNHYLVNAAFRAYPSWRASLEDYVAILEQPMYYGVRVSRTSSYKEATVFLTGRYATDTLYYAKLNNLIESYNLTKYDKGNTNQYSLSGEKVWNPYRRSFTTKDILEQDENWIKHLENKT